MTMNAIQNFFVRAKQWQVFALLIGLSCLAEIVVLWSYPKSDRVEIPTVSLIAAELCWVCFVVWFWCLGSYLYSLISSDLRPSLPFFRLALLYPLAYMGIFQIVFQRLTSPYIFFAIFPVHLFAVFCVFFNLNFVSKSLALAENGRAVSFHDYAGPFFLLWFFPLGIWLVQPRVNHLYAGTPRRHTA